jgi:hypothetical protein
VASLFERALAGPTYDANQQAWDEVLGTLNLRPCYQPAVVKVLSEGRWRNKENPRAYVATAAAQQALAMRLPDFSDTKFRRVSGDESGFDSGEQATRRQSISPPRYDRDGELMPDIVEGAADVADPPSVSEHIPEWLQRGEEYDAVDWETVAVHAAQKPRMAPVLAATLISRCAVGIGRPKAVATALDPGRAREIEAAWKWIDRNWASKIAPLFQKADAPRQLTASDIERFPLLVEGVSLRVDTYVQWDGSTLALVRKGLTPTSDGLIPAYRIDANSIDAAVQILRDWAAEGEPAELFHVWPVNARAPGGTPGVLDMIRCVDSQST